MRKKFSSFHMTSQTGWLWFGGIWFVVGMLFLCIGLIVRIQTINRLERIQKEGYVADGIVIIRSIKPSNGGSKSSTPSYWITYRFSTLNDEVIESEAQVDVDVWNRLKEGGSIQVTYLPHQPQLHRVEGQNKDFGLSIIFTILGSIFTSLGGFVFLRGLSVLRRARRLRQDRPEQTRDTRSDLLDFDEAHTRKVQSTETIRFDWQGPRKNEQVGKSKQGNASTQLPTRKSSLLKHIRDLGFTVLVLLVAGIIDEIFGPFVREFESFFKQYRFQLLGATIGIAVSGFILMMGSILDLLIREPGPKSEGFTLQAMKKAWHSGAWRRESRWRRRFIVTAGGLMMFFGMFGSFFLIGPPSVKLLTGGAVIYALIRLTWAFWHA
jgi:hypothetical protein